MKKKNEADKNGGKTPGKEVKGKENKGKPAKGKQGKEGKGNERDGKRPDDISKIKQRLLDLTAKYPEELFTITNLQTVLNTKSAAQKAFLKDSIVSLMRQGSIVQVNANCYKAAATAATIVGTVDFVNPSFVFIVSDELEEDVKVFRPHYKQVLNGDTVRVRVFPSRREGRLEGEVMEVIERKKTQFAGKIEISKNHAFVTPDSRKMFSDIFIPLDKLNGAKRGDKVIADITSWHKHDKNPKGEVVEILGQAGENDTEMHAILTEFGLPFNYPDNLSKFADSMEMLVTPEELSRRRDFRGITTFTIDPLTAKDFDDALSIRQIKEGLWEVGVHIADVTHFLKEGTELDVEAEKRATSVYLVDRVVPMLPEKLSNHLCSLVPHQDRFTFSAVFELDSNARVVSQWFGKTIIHSDRRFTYEEAQEVLTAGAGDYANELRTLNELAYKLREIKFKEGAIAFESVEMYFVLDEKGKPLSLKPKVRQDAHKLIEDFMLLANKKVAEFVFGIQPIPDNYTMVYRTHGEPDPDKLVQFFDYAQRFGHKLDKDLSRISHTLNQLSKEIEGKPEQNILESLAIRSMAKAIYTTKPDGHYGLGFKHYSHFTSPIRRYPDVMTHRLLQRYLTKGQSADAKHYESMCKQSSKMEKLASDAERASIKYKQVEYMSQFINEEKEGYITGMTEWGIYVELSDTRCEGMLRVADMHDDYYEFDPKKLCVVGRKNQRMLSFGDKVRVKVMRTDLEKRMIDFEFVEGGHKVKLPK